jgi:hypothetical protein
MKIIPHDDYWYQLPNKNNPDKKEKEYLEGKGEFSIYRDEVFKKHINRYMPLLKFYSKFNGLRFEMVLREEPLWYTTSGIEKLLYGK